MKRNRLHSLVCAWAAASIVTGGCKTGGTARVVVPRSAPDPNTPAAIATAAATGRPQIAIDADTDEGRLVVETRDAAVANAAATTTELTPNETKALLARLEPLPDLGAENAKAPTMRAPSAAPPRSGPVQPIAFVAPTGKPVSDAPLAPSRVDAKLAPPQITPEGEVRNESEVRVRFSEPMVAVAAVDTQAPPLATITAPSAAGTQEVAGTWRWIDTRVATFTATGPRFAKATEYTVTVKAGIKAVSGATLSTDATAKFATPPIQISGGYPRTLVHPNSPIVVTFDQDLDPAQVLPKLSIRRAKGGGGALAFRQVSIDEARRIWLNNPAIHFDAARAEQLLGKHHIVLAPKTVWPAGTTLQIALAPGAPSREGPRVSTRATFGTFEVAPPFTVRGVTCGDVETPKMFGASCPANAYLEVNFATPIAIPSYRAAKVQIDGPFRDNQPRGSSVMLDIPLPVGKQHTITIGDGLVDVYGQPYTGAHELGFVTAPERFSAFLYADGGMHVLDPRFQIPQWLVSASAVTSLRVQMYAVQPKDYFAYARLEDGKRSVPPGKRVFDRTYKVGPQHAVDARVDLRPMLNSTGTGHLIALATTTPIAGGRAPERQLAWIQVTRLGVSARIDGERINAWVQDITPTDRFLAPIAGATTTLITDKRGESKPATGDAEGHSQLELFPVLPQKQINPYNPDADDYDDWNKPAVLQASTANDSVFAVVDGYEKAVRVDNALWYVTDDRFTYKPGEKVYVKGWVRWTHNGVNPDLAMPRSGESVAYSITDSKGTKIATGNAKLTSQGGFDLEFEIPKNANLGTASIYLSTRNAGYRHPISVQEFRTPAYSVSLDDDVAYSGARPVILGETLEMTTTAKYYAGGGMSGAPVKWDATLTTTRYAPPGWNLFTFDPPYQRSDGRYSWRRHYDTRSVRAEQQSSLSGASTATVTYGIAALPERRPSILAVDATVTDVDRMNIRASSRPILVHPSAYYVGLRLQPRTVNTASPGSAGARSTPGGGAQSIEAIVTDIDGNAVPGVAIDVELEGVLGSERYRDDANVIDRQHCKLTSAAAPVACPFTRKDVKTAYVARARIADARGRANVAMFDVPWWNWNDGRDLAVIPDKPSYRPGDVAKVEIRTKTFPVKAVMTFARRGVISQKLVELTAASTKIDVPIEASLIPNVFVAVDRFMKRRDTQKGSTLPLPAFDSAEATLAIDIENARLAMRTRSTRKIVQPGEDATFEVEVKQDGKPIAGAEVALMVVDEAVLALSSKTHADPLAPFYQRLANGTRTATSLELVHDSGDELAGPPGVTRTDLTIGTGRYGTIGHGSGTGSGYGVGAGHGGMSGRSSVIVQSRKDFRATAVFSPVLTTDSTGRVSVTVKMPDSLTRFRIVAIAAANDRYFGKAENTIVAQRKVNARTIAPRFLTQGDRFSLPVVVQNLDDVPRTVDVAVRAANLAGAGPAGKRVTVPAGQRAEVRFDFATQTRGRAVVQTIATSGDFADASDVQVPIYEPATTESFATYGVVDDKPQFEQLAVPASIFKDVGGVEVEMSSTQLQSLTDAYWYLYRYPYECAEQRSGRMLATAALYDILDAFATPGRPSRADIDAMRKKDGLELAKTQRADGGWGYFHGIQSDPFVTQQVLTALAAQKITGTTTSRAIAFVQKHSNGLFAKLEQAAAKPPEQRLDRAEHPYTVALAANTLSALAAAGVDVRARAERLHALATKLAAYPVDAKARVLAILAGPTERARPIRTTLLTELLSATHETASSATVTAQFTEAERLLLVSNTKTTALALDAIMRESPSQAIVTKLARGVLDARKYGRWHSTQENLVALQAMRRYFDTYEKVTPSYTGRLWFGRAAYAEQAFTGRTNTRAEARSDWSTLAPGTTHDLALVKQGTGRMYYRVGITYAPREVNLPALDAGFIVRRVYTAEHPADLVKTPEGYRVRLGAKLQVTLEVLATSKRTAVALVDPLPAGFESVNTNLATAERALAATGDSWWDHVNMRDNRSEAFRMRLDEGVHRFSYTVRATTPGTFIAAPAKAEEMYSPETFGRSTGMKVVVE